jgi:hypothetical protein
MPHMKNTIHTPGPWEVTKGLHGKADSLTIWPSKAIDDGGRPLIATVRELTSGAEANAILIAAAPELLSTVKALMDLLRGDGVPSEDVRSSDEWESLMTVIDSAERRML